MRGLSPRPARRWRPSLWVVLLALPCLMPLDAVAGNSYGHKDFAVRLPPAFLRFTEVSTMGGETVANRMSSAINPASSDWLELPGKVGLVIAPYYSPISFDNGTCLQIIGESLTIDAAGLGVFQPIVSQIRTNVKTMRNGRKFDYSVDSYQLQWGRRVGAWAGGAMFNFAKAEVDQTIAGGFKARGVSESYRWRFGGLFAPDEKWLLGAIVEYGFQPYRSKTRVPMPFGLPPMIIRDRGTQHQFVFRPGVSYEYREMSTVFFDYQIGYFHNPEDNLTSHWFTTGVDHRLLQWLWVRGSAGLDVKGNVSLGGGFSVFPAEWCSFDFGYKNGALPEIEKEFGRAHTFQVSFNVRL